MGIAGSVILIVLVFLAGIIIGSVRTAIIIVASIKKRPVTALEVRDFIVSIKPNNKRG